MIEAFRNSAKKLKKLATIPIHKVSVHYCFSTTPNIDSFLKSSHTELRITEGEDWTNVVFSGTSDLYKDFLYEKDYAQFPVRHTKQVLFFNTKTNHPLLLKVKTHIIHCCSL
jgi:hypothetical protein